MKKLMPILLCISTLILSVPVTAYADETALPDMAGETVTEAENTDDLEQQDYTDVEDVSAENENTSVEDEEVLVENEDCAESDIVSSDKAASALSITNVSICNIDNPYTGETKSLPVVGIGIVGPGYGAGDYLYYDASRPDHYDYYWVETSTGTVLGDTDKFEKGKEYSLTVVLPYRYTLNSNGNASEYSFAEDFSGYISEYYMGSDVSFTLDDCRLEDGNLIVEGLYKKTCVDRPENSVRIHEIDITGVDTELREGDTPTVWRGYDETPILINGTKKISKGDFCDKNIIWYAYWVNLEYDNSSKKYTLASPSSITKDEWSDRVWWNPVRAENIEAGRYYGLYVKYSLTSSFATNQGFMLDYTGMPQEVFTKVLVNGEAPAQDCVSKCESYLEEGGDDVYTRSLASGIFMVTRALTASGDPAIDIPDNGYAVIYDANGADGVMTEQQMLTDKANSLSANAFTKTGYTFGGWKDTVNNKVYKDKASVKNLVPTGQTITLSAIWNPNTYSIVFDGNGKSSGVMKSLTKLITDESVTLPKNTFTKKGCNFLGWSQAKNSSPDDDLIADSATVMNLNGNLKNNASVKLYARWEPITYTITFDPDSGMGTEPIVYDVFTKTFKLPIPKRDGYKFAGWYKTADFKKKVSQIAKGTAADMTLYAKWTIVKYTVSYKGGTNTANPKKYTVLDDAIALKDPVRKGYTFAGWYETKDYSGEPVTSINPADEHRNIVLYANWTK